MIIKNWKKRMHLLLVLKNKYEVLGYKGKGDFSLENEKKNIKNF